MKKFLLSMVALLGMGLAASAAEATFDTSNLTNGASGNLVGETFTNNGVTIKFVAGDGQYRTTNSGDHIRFYQGESMAVTSTAAVTKIVCTTVTNSKGAFEVKKNGTAVGNIDGTGVGAGTITWTGNVTGEFEIVAAKQVRFSSIVFTVGEGGSDPDPDPNPDPDPQPTGKKYEMVNALTTGSYVFVINEDGTYKLGIPASATVNYGRISLVAATVENNTVTTDAANAFTITVNGDKATIQDANGRYYGMDTQHLTSFQFYTEHNEGCDYTFAFEGNNVKFTNALNTNCIIAQSKGGQGTWYTNVAPAKEPTEFNLPILFKESESDGIADITVDENAPVEYFNLQGVRVANPENGLYIRRQGNKATKVLVK